IREFHSDSVWGSLRLLFKQLVDALVFRIIGYGIVPFDQNLMTFGVRDDRQRSDGLFGIGDDGFEQSLKVSCYPFDPVAIKQVGTVLDVANVFSVAFA